MENFTLFKDNKSLIMTQIQEPITIDLFTSQSKKKFNAREPLTLPVMFDDEINGSKLNANQMKFNEIAESSTTPFESTTLLMSTEVPIDDVPFEHELMWRIISLIFIVLSTILIVVSICLWRALPSAPFRQNSQITARSSIKTP